MLNLFSPANTERIPGAYLYRTRIGSFGGLISYLWLEFTPSMLALTTIDLHLSALFILAHWSFLACYEFGYRNNDRAPTSKECTDSSRPTAHTPDAARFAFVGTRILFVALTAATITVVESPARALSFSCAVLLIVCLLHVHTRVGTSAAMGAPVRWIFFTWLAFLKYMPALLACLPMAESFSICAILFTCYGAGRVLEYAIRKHGGAIRHTLLDVNACWFMASLPVALVTGAVLITPLVTTLILATLGLHHLLRTSVRAGRIIRRT